MTLGRYRASLFVNELTEDAEVGRALRRDFANYLAQTIGDREPAEAAGWVRVHHPKAAAASCTGGNQGTMGAARQHLAEERSKPAPFCLQKW